MPPSGMPPRGMPPSGMPPRGMPPSGMPPSGAPEVVPVSPRIASRGMFAIGAETAPGREVGRPSIETVADSGPVANGPQSGNAFRPPMPVRLTCPVPLAAAVQTLKLWPPASREKAIRVPSGDQLGSESKIEAPVRFAAPDPVDAFIVQIDPLGPRSLKNAIFVPSGDQSGSESIF